MTSADDPFSNQHKGTNMTIDPKVVTSKVEFIQAEEMPKDHRYIFYSETNNKVMISLGFPPYLREIRNHINDGYPKYLVIDAVQTVYAVEFAAYIIDANMQQTSGFSPNEIEKLKSDWALYGKALGCQALSEKIRKQLQIAAREA